MRSSEIRLYNETTPAEPPEHVEGYTPPELRPPRVSTLRIGNPRQKGELGRIEDRLGALRVRELEDGWLSVQVFSDTPDCYERPAVFSMDPFGRIRRYRPAVLSLMSLLEEEDEHAELPEAA